MTAPSVDRAVISRMLTVPASMVKPRTVDAENQLAALAPGPALVDVTRPTVFSMEWNTPSDESRKYSAATARKRTTHATSDTMKLNFMTDQGSILDTTSCASRRASLGACLDR